jgi:hypothetical protein
MTRRRRTGRFVLRDDELVVVVVVARFFVGRVDTDARVTRFSRRLKREFRGSPAQRRADESTGAGGDRSALDAGRPRSA